MEDLTYSWINTMFTKEEVFEHWKHFMLRLQGSNIDITNISKIINDAFCNHFQTINVRGHEDRRTFIMSPCKHFWYFDYLIEKEERNKENTKVEWQVRFIFTRHNLDYYRDEGESFDITEFFYEFCNPEFLGILEKASLELYG